MLTVASPYVRALLDLAVAKGADRPALLAAAGLDPAGLEDREARLPFDSYVKSAGAGRGFATSRRYPVC